MALWLLNDKLTRKREFGDGLITSMNRGPQNISGASQQNRIAQYIIFITTITLTVSLAKKELSDP